MFEIFQWKLENLPAITNDAYSIWEDELPYVFYYLEKVYYNSNLPYWISEESWEGVINRYDWIFNDNGKTNGLKRWVEEEMVKFDGEDSFEKFRSFVHHVNGTYDIVQKLPDSEELLPLIDYIANRRIDEVNLTVLYDKLLKHLAIEYELVFARNRYEGEVDAMSISGGQFTNVGLRIQDNEGGFHYLFPSKRYSNWLLGEVPYYLQGTKAMFLRFESRNENKASASFGVLPKNSLADNTIQTDISAHLDLESLKATYEIRLKLAGIFSSNTRRVLLEYSEADNIDELEEDLFGVDLQEMTIDSIWIASINKSFPFSCVVRIKASQPRALKKVGDGVYSLRLAEMFLHDLLVDYEDERLLALVPPGYFRQMTRVPLHGEGLLFQNTESNQYSHQNTVGKCGLQLDESTSGILIAASQYAIATNKIPAEAYHELKELNDLVKSHRDLEVLFRISK
ncbi:MAG TPA: hypothetical protein DCX14_01480 [Flavobacteriales bacterium]|nr:hypothetical protein [Flavobacteriales bacterium]